jgi:ABC-type nitrate/sulfonate/bicarbonate transport system substrate-binding protein
VKAHAQKSMIPSFGRCSRREALRAGTFAGLPVALGGCFGPSEVRIGIAFGTPPLWPYVAARKEAVEKGAGVPLRFVAYPNKAEGRAAIRDGKLEFLATQPRQLPEVRAGVGPVQFFLALASTAESLPIIVAAETPISAIGDLAVKRLSVPALDDPGFA